MEVDENGIIAKRLPTLTLREMGFPQVTPRRSAFPMKGLHFERTAPEARFGAPALVGRSRGLLHGDGPRLQLSRDGKWQCVCAARTCEPTGSLQEQTRRGLARFSPAGLLREGPRAWTLRFHIRGSRSFPVA